MHDQVRKSSACICASEFMRSVLFDGSEIYFIKRVDKGGMATVKDLES